MGFSVRACWHGLSLFVVVAAASGCRPPPKPLVGKSQTFAELRAVKRGVAVAAPGEKVRAPYGHERLVDGEAITLAAGGLAWLRRDGGATLLVRGPAALTLHEGGLEVASGKVFVDTPRGVTAEISTPRGALHLSAVRASLEVEPGGTASVYVLGGAVRTDTGVEVGPGERLELPPRGAATKTPVKTWEDWTGGLATTDRAAEPAPFGIGTVGARKPGELGQPRFPLAIQRLDVKVTVNEDFATTEVDEVFENPSSDTVEGIYGFRTPEGATLGRFGVDRGGELMWGRIKEKRAAAAQYQANVDEGSSEDPALLEWDAPGIYKARLYPIRPRETRRVVTRYGEWLGRQGLHGERRLYIYPMAAEGAEGTLPRLEELTFTLDLEHAHAREVRVGMSGKQVGNKVIVKAYDFVPRADLAVELYDDGPARVTAYRAAHSVDREATAADELAKAEKEARGEASYLLVPVRPSSANEPSGGLDLAIVVDTSAATETGSLAIARATAGALLSHLGSDDRAAIWGGDAMLRPVVEGSDRFRSIDAVLRQAIAVGLSSIDRGGATDLGAILSEAAGALDVGRRGAVVYIGDGQPTVGELAVPELRERLGRLPRPVRVFGIGVGDRANMGILAGVARGGFATRVGDAHAAAEAALRVLEQAERPAWLGASVDLGPGIDRVYPRELGALFADESALVVGRVSGALPTKLVVHGGGGDVSVPLLVRPLDDTGDLRRRWAEGRLVQLLDEGAGRAAVVEVGVRSGVITPFTSLYVPTAAERAAELGRAAEPVAGNDSTDSWWRWLFPSRRPSYDRAEASAPLADTEGGTGTRAKGEEGSMGQPAAPPPAQAFGAQAKAAGAPEGAANKPAKDGTEASAGSHLDRQKALSEAGEFGMIGLLDHDSPAPMPAASSATPQLLADDAADEFGKGGLGLSGTGNGGGGVDLSPGNPRGGDDGSEIGFGRLSSLEGKTTASAAPSAKKRAVLHAAAAEAFVRRPPAVQTGAVGVNGRLPPEVVQRIVRQNMGRFRLCYEQALRVTPSLSGRVTVRFVIGPDGSVGAASDAGSTLSDTDVVGCIARSFRLLQFPAPEGGQVTVVYPLTFTPGAGFEGTSPVDALHLGNVGHSIVECSRSADLPVEDRRVLWRERLARVGGRASQAVDVYYRALAGCEAPTFRERAALLSMAVDALGSVAERVALWRVFSKNPAAAEVIYRAILTRVHTAVEIRALHDALGMEHLDPAVLAKALSERHSDRERIELMQGLVSKWPDDLALALELLDALADAGWETDGIALARRLRRRSDATTLVRASVGEYYLRLGSHKIGPPAAFDITEARRTFGEIVEFSPDDPAARRLLGDLLRAHDWYDEALRQYETLAHLAPDDPDVPLLLSLAAEGLGRTEEAIKWTEKAGGAGAPDPTSAVAKTSRALASAFLAWARVEPPGAGPNPSAERKGEIARLRERARRLTAVDVPEGKSARVILTWAHPELHPELWSNALGAPMPASDGDASLGVAQALVPTSQVDGFVELRLSPEDAERAARLRATAMLTVITAEGEDGEKIETMPVTFEKIDGKVLERRRFRLDGGALREAAL